MKLNELKNMYWKGSPWNEGCQDLHWSGPVPETVQAAYRISLAKWIVLTLTDYYTNTQYIENGNQTCGLCMLFLDQGCVGCPIMAATGRKFCSGTPYMWWWDAPLSEYNRIARQELDFLVSLPIIDIALTVEERECIAGFMYIPDTPSNQQLRVFRIVTNELVHHEYSVLASSRVQAQARLWSSIGELVSEYDDSLLHQIISITDPEDVSETTPEEAL